MKIKFVYVLSLSVLSYVVLTSREAGPAAAGLGNRTGSPGSNGSCSGCHSGGTFNPTMAIAVTDGNGNAVTQYRPGQTYTLEYVVTPSSGTPGGYGMQSLIVKSGNTDAGTLLAAVTPNTRITSNRFVEQNGTKATGIFKATWMAPAAGTGNVTIYAMGLAVNNNNNDNGDKATPTTNFVLPEDITAISYAKDSYCSSAAANPLPTITGTTGGSFSASPAGLNLNATTGEITLNGSSDGTYTITYTYAGGTVTDEVAISSQVETADFSFSNTVFCLDAMPNPVPTINGTMGGRFWIKAGSPAPLGINANTGELDLAAATASNAGTYNICYATPGACSDTMIVNITLETCTGVHDADTKHTFALYPNPNKGVFGIQNIGKTGETTITILDVLGRTIWETNAYLSNGEIVPVTAGVSLPAGSYWVRLQQADAVHTVNMQVE